MSKLSHLHKYLLVVIALKMTLTCENFEFSCLNFVINILTCETKKIGIANIIDVRTMHNLSMIHHK